jgi:hypothetical protein
MNVTTAVIGPGVPIDDCAAGGKGASLNRLAQQGFPVPPTAAVPAAAYRIVAEHPDLAGLFGRLAGPATVVPAEVVHAAGSPTSSGTAWGR